MNSTAASPSALQIVREERVEVEDQEMSVLAHTGWRESFPWLVQGTTLRGDGAAPFDLGLFGKVAVEAEVRGNWARLRAASGATRVVHARQVHEAEVRAWDGGAPAAAGPAESSCPDPVLVDPCDGHVSATPGVLLAVTTADCVPVFIVDPDQRAVGMVHAGWRGAAAGILERAVELLGDRFGSRPEALHLHFGPAICGACYEVGPEVFGALGLAEPEHPRPIDLRGALVHRASSLGVCERSMSVSAHCTRCTGSDLFSHRGGHAQRQVGFIGLRGL